MRNLLGQIATQTEPWRAGLAVSGDPSAAGALFPAIPAAAVGRDGPEPSDLTRATQIRFRSHQIRALRSESKRLDLNVMVRPISFAKEPSHFLENNPQSWCVQKNLQFGPEINTQPPELFRF